MKQAHLLWQPLFLQHILTVVIQQSRYTIFHDGSTLILLSLLWQSSSTLLLSVFYHWTLCLEQYTKIPSISYMTDSYIRLVVILWFANLIIDEDNSYWTQSSVFNSNTPNQHSSPSQTLFTPLKLWLYDRQIVQHISWSQGHFTSLHHQANSMDFHLLVWTMPGISSWNM